MLEILGILLVLALILLLTYFFTKYFARFKMGTLGGLAKSSHMRVLDQLTIAPDMRLLVVQVDTQYFLLGVSVAGISYLKELPAEALSLWTSTSPTAQAAGEQPSFRTAFTEALRQKRK